MDGARDVAWAVKRVGCARGKVRAEFEGMVAEVEAAWSRAFSRRLGYFTSTETVPGQVVRLVVRRGDFEGSVELRCDWDPRDAGQIRAIAVARSQRLSASEAAGQRAIRRARGVAIGLAAALGVGFCWLAAGVQMPVIGGLMLTIIITCLLVGGGNLGTHVGEAVAGWRERRVQRAVCADAGVQADIRRWNSVNRELRGHRRALARGDRGGPFRRMAAE